MDKKHEDVAMVAQIDKTSVFQEGRAVHTLAHARGDGGGMRRADNAA